MNDDDDDDDDDVALVSVNEVVLHRPRLLMGWVIVSRQRFKVRHNHQTPWFLQRVGIACYAERCTVLAIVNSSVRPSVRLSYACDRRTDGRTCQNDSSYDHVILTVT